MSGRVNSEDTIPSPCNGVCQLDAWAVCRGCGRTRQEIAAWTTARKTEKEAIVAAARERLKKNA